MVTVKAVPAESSDRHASSKVDRPLQPKTTGEGKGRAMCRWPSGISHSAAMRGPTGTASGIGNETPVVCRCSGDGVWR